MCIFSGNAVVMGGINGVGTILGLSEAKHPRDGYVHVAWYQNFVRNLEPEGANCMFLHIPGKNMTQHNFFDTEEYNGFCEDMVNTLDPPQICRGFGEDDQVPAVAGVEVFDIGVYTVVLAKDARAIPEALPLVPVDKRPHIAPEMCSWFARQFPGWSVALACFNNRDAKKADPILYYYQPLYPDKMIAPAIAAHDGGLPDLSARVEVNHWLIIGSYKKKHWDLKPVDYTQPLPETVEALLPRYIMGQRFNEPLINGDFIVPVSNLKRGEVRATRGLWSP